MTTILDEIVAYKKTEIANRKQQRSPAETLALAQAAPATRGFATALTRTAATEAAIIAEVKRGSPSLGLLFPGLDAAEQASRYENGGAAALSVLTDEHFFYGADADFAVVREQVKLPMLRKDFIIDSYQLYESRALGADCVLLILAILSDSQARELSLLAQELGMDVLAETHTAEEIDRAVANVEFDLLGINNRNLKTFSTNQEITFELSKLAPEGTAIVAESGLKQPADIAEFTKVGIRRFLIGETFVRAADTIGTVRAFVDAG